ncbi:MAG TPA: hypothetical protein VFZ58_00835 [Candidatus Saccharimonadales bacterium]
MNSPALVLDPTTLAIVLSALDRDIFPNDPWVFAANQRGLLQQRFLRYCGGLEWWQLYDLPESLKAKASFSSMELTGFADSCHYQHRFQLMEAGGIGIMTVLELALHGAASDARQTKIHRWNGCQFDSYKGFEVPFTAAQIMNIMGYRYPLVKVPVEDNFWAWFVMAPKPADELALIEKAHNIMALSQEVAVECIYDSVRIPVIRFEHLSNLAWLTGLHKGEHHIGQALQLSRVHLEAVGQQESPPAPGALSFNQPFIAFFSRADLPRPICAFYAERNCWTAAESGLGQAQV